MLDVVKYVNCVEKRSSIKTCVVKKVKGGDKW